MTAYNSNSKEGTVEMGDWEGRNGARRGSVCGLWSRKRLKVKGAEAEPCVRFGK